MIKLLDKGQSEEYIYIDFWGGVPCHIFENVTGVCPLSHKFKGVIYAEYHRNKES